MSDLDAPERDAVQHVAERDVSNKINVALEKWS